MVLFFRKILSGLDEKRCIRCGMIMAGGTRVFKAECNCSIGYENYGLCNAMTSVMWPYGYSSELESKGRGVLCS